VAADVEVVNPRGGMQVERTLHTTDGTFVIDNLSDTSHVYVIRTVYQGISYPGIIRYAGSDTTFQNVTVYDTTSSVSGIEVSIPHMMIRRDGEHFRFETIYEILNATDPPKTITGKPFQLFMPEDLVGVNALYTTELGLPINKEAIPTDDKEIYRIDTPLKPGVTRLALSFDVHTDDGAYRYEQVLPYDLQSVQIMIDDPTIELTGESVQMEKSDNPRGGTIYSASSLAAGSRFGFRVSGGSSAAEASPSSNQRIITQSRATEDGSVPLIVIVTLLLLALPVLGSKKPASTKAEREMAESRKKLLFAQLARLDDLHAAGTVDEPIYQAKRTELINKVAHFMEQTGVPGKNNRRKSKKIKKDS